MNFFKKQCIKCNDNQVFSANDCSESGSDGSGIDASFVLYVSAVTTTFSGPLLVMLTFAQFLLMGVSLMSTC